jgi:hypothetical protein
MALIQHITDSSKLYHDLKQTSSYGDNFTYEGANALQAYLEQMSEDCAMDIDWDPIAFCCEYTEYSDFEELQEAYKDIESLDDLSEHTEIIHVGVDGLIIREF